MEESTKIKIEALQKLLVLNRIQILNILTKQETCVCNMVKTLNIKHNLISHHLKTLLDMGFLTTNRHGQHILYTLVESKRKLVLDLLFIINN